MHTSLWLQCMAAVYDCGFGLVHHPPYSPDLALSDFVLFPNMKNTWLESSIGPMMSYLQLRTFSRIRMRPSISRESKRCNTDGRSVLTAGETMLKINHFDQIRPLHNSQPMNYSAHTRTLLLSPVHPHHHYSCRLADMRLDVLV